MATSFYGGAFFGGEFFNAGTTPPPTPTAIKTGTGGIDPGEGRRRSIFKPTGLAPRKKKGKKELAPVPLETRTDDIALVITPELKPEFRPIATMSQADIHAEIGRLLREKILNDDDEFRFILLMMASQ